MGLQEMAKVCLVDLDSILCAFQFVSRNRHDERYGDRDQCWRSGSSPYSHSSSIDTYFEKVWPTYSVYSRAQ